jgi:hypothetical protein
LDNCMVSSSLFGLQAFCFTALYILRKCVLMGKRTLSDIVCAAFVFDFEFPRRQNVCFCGAG